MYLTLLKSKLHRACVTQVELEYEGSCAIDSILLDTAGIKEYEQVHIYNINNGERFITYAMRADPNSQTISLNGAAARKACLNDRLIICTYGMIDSVEAELFKPALVYLNHNNKIVGTHYIPTTERSVDKG
ncbi:aspartate 1-decarboxylase [Candidatus Nitrosacidococcus tergens]|uniref:Aspartate 1-decarboxylase n=1 Tax=Candidatus Nitrosacidococcus tergens TaxID=553981 RepID=A0A7G1QAG7_9GAMM|nr:aspartate 1-decarboxylase [Candidatus Nitrosacidococcus tergens]CAB1276354.1 aspartate 1-decarboxylase [Candidatus Nitrosacidococcus tergens]